MLRRLIEADYHRRPARRETSSRFGCERGGRPISSSSSAFGTKPLRAGCNRSGLHWFRRSAAAPASNELAARAGCRSGVGPRILGTAPCRTGTVEARVDAAMSLSTRRHPVTDLDGPSVQANFVPSPRRVSAMRGFGDAGKDVRPYTRHPWLSPPARASAPTRSSLRSALAGWGRSIARCSSARRITSCRPSGCCQTNHRWPALLPGGRAFLYTIVAETGGLDAPRSRCTTSTPERARCCSVAEATRATWPAGTWSTSPRARCVPSALTQKQSLREKALREIIF